MTEGRWRTCGDPARLLAFLDGRASERKLRLFAVACCWVEHARKKTTDEQVLGRIDVAERFADDPSLGAEVRARWGNESWPLDAGRWARDRAADDAPWSAVPLATKAALVRDLFGDPFRPVVFTADWRLWSGGPVRQLAEAIYLDKAFEWLPVLADALEEAGCDVPDLLIHLRGPGPHVRGCWAVDLLLGRE